MKTYPACIPCLLKQGLNAVRRTATDVRDEMEVVRRSLQFLCGVSEFRNPPAYYASFVQRIVEEVIGRKDPFQERKKLSNELALRLLSLVQRELSSSEDKLATALKISAAGNSIDFAIRGEFDLEEDVRRFIASDFAVWDYDAFRKRLSAARSVLILGDNAGEIVFDKILVSVLKDMGKEVVYCVKGGPVLNDATLEDARAVSMTELCRVIDNGSRMVGTWLEDCSEDFKRIFFSSDLVLSKGQANFETLDTSAREVFHLLVAKCEPVARETGSGVGKSVLLLR